LLIDDGAQQALKRRQVCTAFHRERADAFDERGQRPVAAAQVAQRDLRIVLVQRPATTAAESCVIACHRNGLMLLPR